MTVLVLTRAGYTCAVGKQFNLSAIEDALRAFQAAFPSINEHLLVKREDVTDTMVERILEAYAFLNELLMKDMDLFTPAGLHSLLEMNHIVLCGADAGKRMEYYHHLQATRSRFMKRIRPIREWVLEHRDSANPRKLAAGFYSRNLSQPQLFIEGNHRTGNILFNYLMVSRGGAPYIVTPETALLYLNISGDIKFTDKGKTLENGLRMPGHRKRFMAMLAEHTDSRFLAA